MRASFFCINSFCFLLLCSVFFILPTNNAYAGFEWIAPNTASEPRQPEKPRQVPLDPLPPLSVDQENGSRDTVYSPSPEGRIKTPATVSPAQQKPRRIKRKVISQPERNISTETIKRPEQKGVKPWERVKKAQKKQKPDSIKPRQLKMSERLVVPEDYEDPGTMTLHSDPPIQENVSINPYPLKEQARRDSPASPDAVLLENDGTIRRENTDRPRKNVAISHSQPDVQKTVSNRKKTPTASSPLLESEVLMGFGNDIPLVMALRQIIPSDYTFSFAKGVNMGANVSWQGGRSWRQALQEMLESKNLTAVFKDKNVSIQPEDYAKFGSAKSSYEEASAAPLDIKKVLAVEPEGDIILDTARPDKAESRTPGITIEGVKTAQAEQGPSIKDMPDPKKADAAGSKQEAEEQPYNIAAYAAKVKSEAQKNPHPVRRRNIIDPGEQEFIQLGQKQGKSKSRMQEDAVTSRRRLSVDDMARMQGVDLKGAEMAEVQPAAGQPQKLEILNSEEKERTKKAPAGARFWEAQKGQDLKTVLERWAAQSKTELVWDASKDYNIGSTIMVHGSFNDAVKTLFEEGTKSGAFPVMRLRSSGPAQSRLIVENHRQS